MPNDAFSCSTPPASVESLRSARGNYARTSRQPSQPLVFWGYEVSPFVKLAREVLCELELPYMYRTAARGSAKRQELLDMRGTFQVGHVGARVGGPRANGAGEGL